MATFSSENFNSALYQSFRPGYNANFYNMVYNYHSKNGGQFITAVDIGTGKPLCRAQTQVCYSVLIPSAD
jgi:hypothetical protein